MGGTFGKTLYLRIPTSLAFTSRSARRPPPPNFANSTRLTVLVGRRRLCERFTEIQSALPLTSDSAIIQASVLMAQTAVDQLRILTSSIDHFNQVIQGLFRKHADHDLFYCLPGAGDVLAPRLLVAFGSDRTRYQDADEVERFTGIAPVVERSGKGLLDSLTNGLSQVPAPDLPRILCLLEILVALGHRPTISNPDCEEWTITPQSARWRSSGSVFSTGAGKAALFMTRPFTSARFSAEGLLWHTQLAFIQFGSGGGKG